MPLTLTELKELLIKEDEVSLLEVLDISSEDLVDRFEDLIEKKFDDLAQEYQDYETTDE